MKKSDLRTGDIIERRNGRIEMVVGNVHGLCAFISRDDGYNHFKDIGEDLYFNKQYPDSGEWDVIKVRRPNAEWQFKTSKWEEAPVIWELKRIRRVTMKQICEAFDCEGVEILGEKEIAQNVYR